MSDSTHGSSVDCEMTRLNDLALSASHRGVLICDEHRRIVMANPGFEKLTGYSSAEVLGKNCSFLQGKETDPGTVEKLRSALRAGQSFDGEILNYRKDGSAFWNELSIVPIHDENGRLVRFVGIHQDVTARKRVGESLGLNAQLEPVARLQMEKARLIAAQSVARIGSWETDFSTLEVTWSAETYRIFGINPEDFRPTHQGFLEFVHPEDRARVDEAFVRSVGNPSAQMIEHRLLLPDGSIVYVEERWQTFFNEEGKPLSAIGTCQEITSRKESELATERMLHRLTEAQRIGLIGDWEWEPTSNKVSWSPQVYEIFGLDPSSGPPPAFEDQKCFFDAENWKVLRKRVHQALTTGEPQECEVWGLRPDGEQVRIQARAVPRKDESARVCGLYGTVQDITLLKKVQLALRESEDRFASAFENAPIGVALVGLDGKWLKVNRAVCDLVGYTKAELMTLTFQDITYPEDLASDLDNVRQLLDGTIRVYEMEKRYIHAQGHLVTVLLTVTLVRDEQNKPSYFISQIQDITERKKAEEALILTSKRLELAAKASKVGIWEWDIANGVLHWDEQMFALYGMDSDPGISGLDLWQRHLHPEDYQRVQDKMNEALQPDGIPFDMSFRILVQPGNIIRHIRAQSLVLRDENSRPIRMLGTNWDETEQVEREEMLRKNLETERTLRLQASAGENAKSEFLAVMSHEIRTPMNGVIGFAEVLLQSPDLSPEDREITQTIVSSGEALLRILDDILDFSRIEAGRLAIEKRIFSPRELIDGIRALFHRKLQEKGLEFIISMDSDLPDGLEGDAGRIRQILINLIGNALKFTEHGSIEVSARVSKQAEGEFLEFAVRDSGMGIRPDRVQAIFEPFAQEDSSISRRHGGTGLGITISRRLAELMGGSLQLTSSQPGVGTTFTLLLPIGRGENTKTSSQTQDGTGLKLDENFALQRPQKILVVEDDKVNLKLILFVLRKLGYTPLIAGTGTEALATFSRENPDCILMDVQMPDMDGLEATRKIRETEKNRGLPPVFISAITANTMPEDRQRCFDAGVNAYLNKPLKLQAIANVLVEAEKSRKKSTI